MGKMLEAGVKMIWWLLQPMVRCLISFSFFFLMILIDKQARNSDEMFIRIDKTKTETIYGWWLLIMQFTICRLISIYSSSSSFFFLQDLIYFPDNESIKVKKQTNNQRSLRSLAFSSLYIHSKWLFSHTIFILFIFKNHK